MTKKAKANPLRGLIKLMLLFSAILDLGSRVGRLLSLEFHLAKKNLVVIFVLAILLAILFASTWIAVLAWLFIYLLSIHWTASSALLLLIAANLILTLLVGYFIVRAQKQFAWPLSWLKHRNNS